MKFLALLMLVAFAAADEQKRYDGYKVYKVFALTKSHAEFVRELSDGVEISSWYEGHDHTDIFVPPHLQEGFEAQLRSRSIGFEVVVENQQSLIDMEKRQMLERKVLSGQAVDYNNWNSYADIMAELRALAARCPSTVQCQVISIGNSLLGNSIDALQVTRPGANRRTIWIDATIHAREWLGTATHLNIMKRIVDEPNNPQVVQLLNNYNFFFIPVSNPDGYIWSWTNDRMWRKNRRTNSGSTCLGVDLNRNFNQMFANAGTSTNPCSETYRGTAAASEPETQVIQAALNARHTQNAQLHFSMHIHTYGNLWLIPWGSVVSGNNCNYAADHAQMMVVANAGANAVAATYNTSWARGNSCATIYPASGITMDYSKGVSGVFFTVTPELRGGNFVVNVNQIPLSFNEIWNGVVATANSVPTS